MKKIAVYETKDGQLFKSKTEAQKHEDVDSLVRELREMLLPKKFNTCDFANGGGYIQLSHTQVANFRQAFQDAIRVHHKDLAELANKNPTGILGRYLCDGSSPLYSVWTLLCQIDTSNRLWGQPYYAINPSEGDQIQLNK